jgi:transposase
MTRDEYFEIRKLHDEGLTVRAIARRLGVHRRKVRAALKSPIPPASSSTRRGSIIDPYRGWILAKLQQYPQLSASRIHQMLTEQGFSGSYTLVKEVVAELRPRVQTVYQSLDFAPGECAQVDWGVWDSVDVPGGRRRLSFFAMVLCDSRMLYAELTFGESLEFWLQAHRNAFEYFGGVPERVMVDNCKTAVITPRRGDKGATLNADYAAFADYYRFQVVPCAPRQPQQKGRVEKAVGYVKTAFLAGREPATPEALNPLLRAWLDDSANTRQHRSTGFRPIDAFHEREKAALRALPSTGVVANSCCRVTVGDNRYSIPPAHARKRLILHRGVEHIYIYSPEGELIAEHPRSYARKAQIIDPEHQQALRHLTTRARQNRQVTDFLALGGQAGAYILHLKHRHPDYHRHLREINALVDIYGPDPVRRAIADSHAHGAYAASYILSHLQAQDRRRADTPAGPLHILRNADLLDLQLPPPDLSAYDDDSDEDGDTTPNPQEDRP